MVRVMIQNEIGFVWNADDWKKLRQEHRLIGTLKGCLAHVPRQEVENGLPMKLLPEEVTLIKEKNFGQILTYADPKSPPSIEIKNKYDEYNEKIKNEQVKYSEEKRKTELLGMIDRIVEGKRRKLSRDSTAVVDRDEILKTEMEKITLTNFLAGVNCQTPTEHPWFSESDFKPAVWDYPRTPFEKLKYRVFKNLWEKGYYLTSGNKFGGHFLVYPGEPLKFHAFFIVYCALRNESFPMSKIIAHSRLGTVTKKTFVIASVKEDGEIFYNSLEWMGIT